MKRGLLSPFIGLFAPPAAGRGPRLRCSVAATPWRRSWATGGMVVGAAAATAAAAEEGSGSAPAHAYEFRIVTETAAQETADLASEEMGRLPTGQQVKVLGAVQLQDRLRLCVEAIAGKLVTKGWISQRDPSNGVVQLTAIVPSAVRERVVARGVRIEVFSTQQCPCADSLLCSPVATVLTNTYHRCLICARLSRRTTLHRWCTRAKELLEAKGWPPEATDVVRVDLDMQAAQRMVSETGKRTVPQISLLVPPSTVVGGEVSCNAYLFST